MIVKNEKEKDKKKMFKFVLFVWCVGLCTCEVSPRARSSWNQPKNSALNVEYGAPPQTVHISRENVKLAGQSVEISSLNKQHSLSHPLGQLRQSKTTPTVS